MDKYSGGGCSLREVEKPQSLPNVAAAYEVITPVREASLGDIICTGPQLPAGARWPAIVVARLHRGGIVFYREVCTMDPALIAWAAAILFIIKKGRP